jgi:hypothetical protein
MLLRYSIKISVHKKRHPAHGFIFGKNAFPGFAKEPVRPVFDPCGCFDIGVI